MAEDEEIRQDFEDMYQSVEQLDNRVHTGNAVSDAVVGSKFRYAAKKVKGIQLDARGFMLSGAITIKAYDMGIFFSNVKEMMEMQYNAHNLAGYAQYRKIWDVYNLFMGRK